jgi:hypothetical protein
LGAQAAVPKAFVPEVSAAVVGAAVLADPHPATTKTHIINTAILKIFVTFI